MHPDCQWRAVCCSAFAVPLAMPGRLSGRVPSCYGPKWCQRGRQQHGLNLCSGPVLFTITDVAREVRQVREPVQAGWSGVPGNKEGKGKVQG